MSSSEIYAYGVFQGGGAKGYAHVGALRAAEAIDVKFRGFAGTSAGAVVAALAAAGYTADEIFDFRTAESVLGYVGMESPIELFARSEWRAFRFLRAIWGNRWLGVLRHFAGALAGVTVAVARWLTHRSGLFDTKILIDTLDELLYLKLAANAHLAGTPEPERPIRFHHLRLPQPGATLLKIVATDVTNNRLVLFSVNDTPDVVVAEAVAASVAVPFLFEPVQFDWPSGSRATYVDGGLASNLPVWVFAEEKRVDARFIDGTVPVVAFAFDEPDEPRPSRLSLAALVSRVAAAALSTGQHVTRDFVADLHVVAVACHLPMLDLGASLRSVKGAYAQALLTVHAELGRRLRTRPAALRVALEGVHAVAHELLGAGASAHHLRVALIEPVKSRYGVAAPLNFSVTATCGFEDDPDDRLLLDAGNVGAPTAFASSIPNLWRRPANWSTAAARELGMTKYERAMVPTRLMSAVQLPVFSKAAAKDGGHTGTYPTAVVSVDSDLDLTELSQNDIAMASLAKAVDEYVGHVLRGEIDGSQTSRAQ